MKSQSSTTKFISKSQYIRGRQCLKSLWLYRHRPEIRDEIGTAQQAVFDAGTDVGVLAQQYFPGGVLIPYDGFTLLEQMALTQTTIENGVDVIYEAAFCYENVFFKADILRKTAAGWEIYEVKASTAVKEVHIEDIALQSYVLQGLGMKLANAYLMHINNQYIRQGDIEIRKLFSVEDVTYEIDALRPEVARHIASMRTVLKGGMPSIDIGPHCSQPYDCDFREHCWQHIPSPSVFDFARIGKKAFELYNRGILHMEDTPPDELNDKQLMQLEAWKQQKKFINLPELRRFIDSLSYPLCFMDFETFATPVPLYDGIRPYQQVTFQYSLHVLNTKGAVLKHYEYLADGAVNPQRDFIESLLRVVHKDAMVLVWNATFERQRLQELMQVFPDKEGQIQKILDNMVDLMLPFQRRYIYKPGFQGSYSIKKVLPYMVEELSYQELDINNGTAAMAGWLQMRNENKSEERDILRQQLIAYCQMDTYAMVEILEKMQQIAQGDADINANVIGVTICQDPGTTSNCARLTDENNLELNRSNSSEEAVKRYFDDLRLKMDSCDKVKKEMTVYLPSSLSEKEETCLDNNSNRFTKEAITKYFSELQFRMNIYDDAKKDMDVYLASSFSVFHYIKTDENKLSEIIGDLLNPQGKHGQRDTFLQVFIDLLPNEFSHDLFSCRVARETSTAYIVNNQRRMDITLKFADEFEIAIENKPWDSEQENQLQDYQEHLTRKYGEKFCLVYISGDGSPPVSITSELKDKMLADGRLVVLTYAKHAEKGSLLQWLESCYKECKAEKIRNFIKDFITYIEGEFENSYDDGEDEEDGK